MGMAASQARFLGLTARKTNTEYEGQQINQQRTTLSNQSANYYNQLLGMSVPVPPSIEDYTKTVYTFTDGALSNTITAMTAKGFGLYNISYVQSYNNDFAVVAASPTVYTRVKNTNNNYEYYVGSVKLRPLTQISENDFRYRVTYIDQDQEKTVDALYDKENNQYYTVDDEGVRTNYTPKEGTTPEKVYSGDDQYLKTLTYDQIQNLQKEEEQYLSMLNDKYGNGNWLVRYVYNSTTKAWTPYFVNQNELDDKNTTYNDDGISQSSINTYTVGSAVERQEIKGVEAMAEFDGSGRIINITLNPNSDNPVTYNVTTNTQTDQDKYDDAMNQYEYDKYQYDQSIQEINAKIEVVQAQDKNLELRLKQLDTEQDAIQTEMDAVQKVIEKNTESTFKTFG